MKTKPIVLGVIAAGLLMSAGGAAAYWMTRDGLTATIVADGKAVESDAKNDVEHAADDAVAQPQPIYYSFNGPFTTNLKHDTDIIRVEVAVSSHYANAIDAVKNDDPALRSVIIDVLSSAPEDVALTDAGKHQLEAGITTAINNQLKADGYATSIDAAYFTSFVAQPSDG